MASINRLAGSALKDAPANILDSEEFVVHLADEAIAERLNACAEALPRNVSAVEVVELSTLASVVAPPRLREAPVAFACRSHERLQTDGYCVFFGSIERRHVREGLVDTKRGRARLQRYFPVGRFGANSPVRTLDRFAIQAASEALHRTSIDEI